MEQQLDKYVKIQRSLSDISGLCYLIQSIRVVPATYGYLSA